jgi:E3 ubiquitin-protein ligase HERC4
MSDGTERDGLNQQPSSPPTLARRNSTTSDILDEHFRQSATNLVATHAPPAPVIRRSNSAILDAAFDDVFGSMEGSSPGAHSSSDPRGNSNAAESLPAPRSLSKRDSIQNLNRTVSFGALSAKNIAARKHSSDMRPPTKLRRVGDSDSLLDDALNEAFDTGDSAVSRIRPSEICRIYAGTSLTPIDIFLDDGITPVDFVSIDGSGGNRTIALTSEGKLYGWGHNGDGELALDGEDKAAAVLGSEYENRIYAKVISGTLQTIINPFFNETATTYFKQINEIPTHKHGLVQVPNAPGWYCDGCRVAGGGTAERYHCPTGAANTSEGCDFDLCGDCYRRQQAKAESRMSASSDIAEIYNLLLKRMNSLWRPSDVHTLLSRVFPGMDLLFVNTQIETEDSMGTFLEQTLERYCGLSREKKDECLTRLYEEAPGFVIYALFQLVDEYPKDEKLNFVKLSRFMKEVHGGEFAGHTFDFRSYQRLCQYLRCSFKDGLTLEKFHVLMHDPQLLSLNPRKFVGESFVKFWSAVDPKPTTHLRSQGSAFTSIPTLLAQLSPVKIAQVSCGADHTAVLTTTHVCITFGNNQYGQLGRRTPMWTVSTPRAVEMPSYDREIVQVRCGNQYTLILTSLGQLYSCGNNAKGVLGRKEDEDLVSSKKAKEGRQGSLGHIASLSLTAIVDMSAGHDHVLACTLQGQIYVWGNNAYGQLGVVNDRHDFPLVIAEPMSLNSLRTTLRQNVPKDHVVAVVAGAHHSIFVTFRGSIFGCGLNTSGQLGRDGRWVAEYPVFVPFPVHIAIPSISAVVGVACGKSHTLALTEDGTVYGFNQNVWKSPGQIITNTHAHAISVVASGGDGDGDIYCIGHRCESEKTFDTTRLRATARRSTSMLPKRNLVRPLSKGAFRAVRDNALRTGDFMDAQAQIVQLFANPAALNVCFNGVDTVGDGAAIDYVTMKELYTSYNDNDQMVNLFYDAIHDAILRVKKVVHLLDAKEDLRCIVLLLLNPQYLIRRPSRTLNQYIELCSLFGQLTKRAMHNLSLLILDHLPSEVIVESIVQPTVWLFENELKLTGRGAVQEGGVGLGLAKFLAGLHRNRGVCNARHIYEIKDSLFYCPYASSQSDEYFAKDFVAYTHEVEGMGDVFTFCKYSFFLTSVAKRRILRIESTIRMRTSMQHAVRRMIIAGVPESRTLGIQIRRTNLLADSISIARKLREEDLRKPLQIKFHQEAGIDAGGVKREYFALLVEEAFDPNYGHWRMVENNGFWFSSSTLDAGDDIYYLVGLLCGLAIYNDVILDLHFPLALYKLLKGVEPTLEDLKEIEPSVYAGLRQLRDYEGDDVEDVFCLDFEITFSGLGGEENRFDLLSMDTNVSGENVVDHANKKGCDVPVTSENRGDYLSRYIRWFFSHSIQEQFKNFADGFLKVANGIGLNLFTPLELEELVEGETALDFSALEDTCQYEGGFTKGHPSVVEFWSIVHAFNDEQKCKFLRFVTAASRAPTGGLKNLDPPFKLQRNGPDSNRLPTSATCFNTLLLPEYANKAKTAEMLFSAIENSSGFGLE